MYSTYYIDQMAKRGQTLVEIANFILAIQISYKDALNRSKRFDNLPKEKRENKQIQEKYKNKTLMNVGDDKKEEQRIQKMVNEVSHERDRLKDRIRKNIELKAYPPFSHEEKNKIKSLTKKDDKFKTSHGKEKTLIREKAIEKFNKNRKIDTPDIDMAFDNSVKELPTLKIDYQKDYRLEKLRKGHVQRRIFNDLAKLIIRTEVTDYFQIVVNTERLQPVRPSLDQIFTQIQTLQDLIIKELTVVKDSKTYPFQKDDLPTDALPILQGIKKSNQNKKTKDKSKDTDPVNTSLQRYIRQLSATLVETIKDREATWQLQKLEIDEARQESLEPDLTTMKIFEEFSI